MTVDEKIKEVTTKLNDITEDIKKNGKIVHDWGKPFLISQRTGEAYDVLREFTKWLEEDKMNWEYEAENGEMSVESNRECDCEHCGPLEPYDLTFSDGIVAWCEDCASSNAWMPSGDIMYEARGYSLRNKRLYFEKRIQEVENELADLRETP